MQVCSHFKINLAHRSNPKVFIFLFANRNFFMNPGPLIVGAKLVFSDLATLKMYLHSVKRVVLKNTYQKPEHAMFDFSNLLSVEYFLLRWQLFHMNKPTFFYRRFFVSTIFSDSEDWKP